MRARTFHLKFCSTLTQLKLSKSRSNYQLFLAIFQILFSNFQIQFIWKYEVNDDIAEDLPNVLKSKWIPQNDLLGKHSVASLILRAFACSEVEFLANQKKPYNFYYKGTHNEKIELSQS